MNRPFKRAFFNALNDFSGMLPAPIIWGFHEEIMLEFHGAYCAGGEL